MYSTTCTVKMSTEDYLTDASSLDALSEFGDGKCDRDFVVEPREERIMATPKIGRILAVSTPTPLLSKLDIHTPVGVGIGTHNVPFNPEVAYMSDESLFQDEALMNALKELGIEVKKEIVTEENVLKLDITKTILIFSEFTGELFESCKRKPFTLRPRIYGPAAILAASMSKEQRLPVNRLGYPVYSLHLLKCKIAATGIASKETLVDLRRKILYMGGTYMDRRCDRGAAEAIATHLVADKCRGVKYQDAVSLGRPIVKPEWIENLWSHRNNIFYDQSLSLKDYRVKCFHACKIAFSGFSQVEKAEMTKLVLENGGIVVEAEETTATHIVKKGDLMEETVIDGPDLTLLQTPPARLSNFGLRKELEGSPMKRARIDRNAINDLIESEAENAKSVNFPGERAKVVKAEWFWNSIQIDACSDEKPYLLEGRFSTDLDYTVLSCGTPGSITSPTVFSDQDFNTPKSGTPGSTGRRKRKWRREFVSTLAQPEYPRFVSHVTDDKGVPNLGGKSLDEHTDVVSDAEFANILNDLNKYLTTADVKTMTRRQIEFYQLLETERNYVSVLMNIVKIFKEPCENEDQPGGRILSPLEIKTIFSTMLPIFAIHRKLLRDLFQLQSKWDEENLIGKIYFELAADMRKAYEPFVNYFESVKNEIQRCEAEKPRFMALLRIAQCKPECGKQSLAALMIRPVQRLPSTSLILQNLKKFTPKTNPDHEWLTKGLEALSQCITSLNEEKAKNEARVAMFETFSEIDGCPAKTISEHRSLLNRIDVTTLTDYWGQKFDPMTIFVYTDHIQITKRRGFGVSGKGMGSGMSMANLRSPSISRKSIVPGSAGSTYHNVHHKKYKFCEWIDFVEIKRILDVYDTQTPSFAFVVRGARDLRERILVFTCPDDFDWDKQKLLDFFAKQLGNAVNRVDYVNLIAKADSASLNVNENTASVFDTMARCAKKTGKKVSRALSLNRTPSKIKRTMSQMISPFTSARRPDPDCISQFSIDSPPPPPPKHLAFGK